MGKDQRTTEEDEIVRQMNISCSSLVLCWQAFFYLPCAGADLLFLDVRNI